MGDMKEKLLFGGLGKGGEKLQPASKYSVSHGWLFCLGVTGLFHYAK